MVAVAGLASDLLGVWPLVLSLDSGRAMVCARQVEIRRALTPDGQLFWRVPIVAVQITADQIGK